MSGASTSSAGRSTPVIVTPGVGDGRSIGSGGPTSTIGDDTFQTGAIVVDGAEEVP